MILNLWLLILQFLFLAEGAPKLTFRIMVSKDPFDPVWLPPVMAECCNIMSVPRPV